MVSRNEGKDSLYNPLLGQRFVRKIAVVITFFIGVFYVSLVVSRLTEDTTTMFNVAVGVSGALSGLCFRMSSSIDENGEHKKRMAYSGERFLHATLNLLTASILKYAALEIDSFEWIHQWDKIAEYSEVILHTLSLPLFIWAVYDFHTGLTIANDMLWERLYNDDKWDSIV